MIPAPVGTGIMIAGGNRNFVHRNHIYDNWRNGVMLFGVPATIRGEPGEEGDTSHFNEYVANLFGILPDDGLDPNGLDVWWDDQGEGNCWQDNQSSHGEVTSNTLLLMGLPDCDSGGSPGLPANPEKQGQLAPCVTYDRSSMKDPPGCDWFDTPPEPGN